MYVKMGLCKEMERQKRGIVSVEFWDWGLTSSSNMLDRRLRQTFRKKNPDDSWT